MTEIEQYTEKVFEDIKHIDEEENEFWEARELQKVLGYKEWRYFDRVIKKAQTSCLKSGNDSKYHFGVYTKMINIAKGGKRKIKDYRLSRYACYLIAQNGDSHINSIALAQTYFAIQTRKMELTEKEYSRLTEDEKRLYKRKQTKDGNKALYKIAVTKGVKNFDKFTNAGYRGLYNGENADDIAKRKGLRYREEILDHMGSSELSANLFRITQTEELLERQKEKSEKQASETHFKVGSSIRQTIKELGNTMLENLPTPNKSIKELEKIK
ncbi:MAG: DNA damage-inducible protein D [Firmicutes bacterium]|nr:DNA damage-inducible protein D [Bacillota bacterium]